MDLYKIDKMRKKKIMSINEKETNNKRSYNTKKREEKKIFQKLRYESY